MGRPAKNKPAKKVKNVIPVFDEEVEETAQDNESTSKSETKKEDTLSAAIEEVKSSMDPAKESLKEYLTSQGVNFLPNVSLQELTNLVVLNAKKLSENQKLLTEDKKERNYRNYATTTNISDEKLKRNMFNWGIPDFYLNAQKEKRGGHEIVFYIFQDSDVSLSKNQILQKIRTSGKNHIDTTKAISAIANRFKRK